MASLLTLSFDLGGLDSEAAESACRACGAAAVTFADSRDDPVLEPLPGEFRLWRETRLTALFVDATAAPAALTAAVAGVLGMDPALIEAQSLADRSWEREWLRDFHAMRFGERLWVCPTHERVSAPGAVVVNLDPGLAFGTGAHASTALCLEWLDAHLGKPPAPAEHSVERPALGLDAHLGKPPAPAGHWSVIDYGCGSGVLALAAARLGAATVHCFDIDPQALLATHDNAAANAVGDRVRVCGRAAELPRGVDLLLANILSGPLCALAPTFATLVRPGGQVVLAGLMLHEVAEVTAAYAACFDVSRFGEREEWVCLSGRRRC